MMKEKKYNTLAEFNIDIEKFTQFCIQKFPNSEEIKKSCNELINVVESEIKQIEMCAQCFSNAIENDNPMVQLCDPPHLLVWAKTEGFIYWPAKLMSIDGESAEVIYFGEFLQSRVPVDKCLIYTVKRPDASSNVSNKKLFNTSLGEAKRYIENITAKYGSFNYAIGQVKLDPGIITEQCENMIKKTNEPIEQSIITEPRSQRTTERKRKKAKETPKTPTTPKPVTPKRSNALMPRTPITPKLGDKKTDETEQSPTSVTPEAIKPKLDDEKTDGTDGTGRNSSQPNPEENPSMNANNESSNKRRRLSEPFGSVPIHGESSQTVDETPLHGTLNSVFINAKDIMDEMNHFQVGMNQMSKSLQDKDVQLSELKAENERLKEEAMERKTCSGCGLQIKERRYCNVQCCDFFFQ